MLMVALEDKRGGQTYLFLMSVVERRGKTCSAIVFQLLPYLVMASSKHASSSLVHTLRSTSGSKEWFHRFAHSGGPVNSVN